MRRLLNPNLLLAPILLSTAIFIYCMMVFGTAYVANPDYSVDVYTIIGDFDYRLQDGSIVRVENPDEGFETIVVNDTEEVILIEEIVYVANSFPKIPSAVFDLMSDSLRSGPRIPRTERQRDYFVLMPQSHQEIFFKKQKIDYFFDDEIPDEIEESGSGASVKYWMHLED